MGLFLEIEKNDGEIFISWTSLKLLHTLGNTDFEWSGIVKKKNIFESEKIILMILLLMLKDYKNEDDVNTADRFIKAGSGSHKNLYFKI